MSDITAAGAFAAPRSRRVKDLIAVNFGNTLEWFDWTIYTIFAPYFALQFFPSADKSAALLAALAVFAAGFLTRPLGGFLFGLYADRVGRKKSLTLAMFITAGGSLVIALAPNFATVGLAASVILLVARLAQGIAHGGDGLRSTARSGQVMEQDRVPACAHCHPVFAKQHVSSH